MTTHLTGDSLVRAGYQHLRPGDVFPGWEGLYLVLEAAGSNLRTLSLTDGHVRVDNVWGLMGLHLA